MVSYDRDERTVTVTEQGGNLNLVGVLKGHTNGSWQSPQSAPQELVETHFQDLPLELKTPVGQWGLEDESPGLIGRRLASCGKLTTGLSIADQRVRSYLSSIERTGRNRQHLQFCLCIDV